MEEFSEVDEQGLNKDLILPNTPDVTVSAFAHEVGYY